MAQDPSDPVKALFDALPDVGTYDAMFLAASGGSISSNLLPQLTTFVSRVRCFKAGGNNFTDADGPFLFGKINRILQSQHNHDSLFITTLSELALSKGQTLHDTTTNSKKTRYLRYAAWLAGGRRDPESPFEPASPRAQPPPPREHYANLTAQAAKQSQGHCAHCGKHVDHPVSCKQCLVDERWADVRVSYCDEYCQNAGWPSHKSTCRSRRLLGRAVSIVLPLNRTFETYTFDFSYKRAVVKDGIVRLEEFTEGFDDRMGGCTLIPDAFKGGFVFRTPPHVSGIDSAASHDYNEAVLRFSKCGELGAVQWNFIEPFLDCKCLRSQAVGFSHVAGERDASQTSIPCQELISVAGVCSSILEMTIQPKNASIVVSRISPYGLDNGMLSNHVVFHAKLANGEAFIIDIAGSQYGYHEVLSLEKDFVKCRVASCQNSQPVGQGGRGLEAMMRMFTPGDCVEKAGSLLKEELAREICSQVRLYLASKGFAGGNAIKRMLGSDGRTFGQCREGILSLTKRVVTGSIERYKSEGRYCLCLDTNLSVRVTDNRHWAEVYKKLWLNDEEWQPIRNNQQALISKWLDSLERSGSDFLSILKQSDLVQGRPAS